MKNDYDIIVGIDLGLTGGISFFDCQSGELLSIYPMPTKVIIKGEREKKVLDIDKLHFLLEIPKEHNDNALVIFEDIHAFGSGGFSMDVIMEQKGVLRGLIRGFDYTPCAVHPKTWQKHFGIVPPKSMKKKETRKTYLKNQSRKVAQGLFPGFAHKFELKGSHGLSDATLLGRFWLDTVSN
jgi:hypothetical protein